MRVFAGAMAGIAGMGCIFVYGACAAGDELQPDPPGLPESDGGTTQLAEPDAGAGDSGALKDAGDGGTPLFCSAAGWCETRFPDDTRSAVADLWPVDGTVFAARNGIEQFDGTAWVKLYNESTFRSIWAPNADEVWAGTENGTVVHGTRSGGTWTWSTDLLAAGYNVVGSIWGSSADDVYVATLTKLYHRVANDDGGGPRWVVAYEDPNPPSPGGNDFGISQVTGSGPNDVWVLASRSGRCSTLVHKEHGEFTTLVDCETKCNPDNGCYGVPRPPALFMPDGLTRYAFVLQERTVVTTNAGQYGAGSPRLQRMSLSPEGELEVTSMPAEGAAGTFLWGTSESDLWSVGQGVVTHSSDAFTDGGKFTISTLVLNGAPLVEAFNIRGTGASDIWVFGGPYALHKTKL